MYTLVNTNERCCIKEFVNWNDLLDCIDLLELSNLSLDIGKNYVDFFNFSTSIYIIGLSKLEIEYFKNKFE